MDKELEGFFAGCILGDGSISKRQGRVTPYYRESHSLEQLPYLEWKRTFVEEVVPCKTYEIFDKKLGKNFYMFESLASKELEAIYQLSQAPVFDILNQLTPLGLAVWFMDDGTIYNGKNKKTKAYATFNVTLGTYRFDYEEHVIIQKWFNDTFGFNAKIAKKRTDTYNIRFTVKDSTAFLQMTKPYAHPALLYKWDVKCRDIYSSVKAPNLQ